MNILENWIGNSTNFLMDMINARKYIFIATIVQT
uniref:Uncharacterized protein n=1 Tax=Arundo donax TaxID=35708 RepID=A0A0A9EKN7_ARUDO